VMTPTLEKLLCCIPCRENVNRKGRLSKWSKDINKT
jgi:hypothetical protein